MASSSEKIVEYHISRLADKRADVRLRSIAELEAMGAQAEAALDALKKCHDTSDEEEVRKAAMEAGYKIFMEVKKSKPGE